ncbi:MAG: flagellar filament capping protein FliD [Verrucomicrobia bacterium]|nr:flagellar filament capping protein FliD [Verrucomicrobiota bacterium]
MDLGVSGLVSGFDWRSMVNQLSDVERAPQRRLRTEQGTLQQKNTAYGAIQTQLSTLMSKAQDLSKPELFDSRLAVPSDTTIATATSATNSAVGSYTFAVTQLATSSVQRGADDAGNRLSVTDDVSGVTLNSAGFSIPVTAGVFTVNGKRIDVATTDTLQQVFDKISSATGGVVSASYSSSEDKIHLNASGGVPVVLGSSNDTSNFLAVARLNNNNSDTVTSGARLGAVRSSATLDSANFRIAVSDGGSGAGKFRVNGVDIAFNASSDSVNDVLARINNSSAGVTASYDSLNDRFTLTNKSTGDLGVALENVTGNFLTATGLASGTLVHGQNLQYRLNDGADVLTSQSNTIDESSSGVVGLSLSVLKAGTVTVQVGADTAKIKQAIVDFVAEFNKSHGLIDNYTASSTDKTGKVTAAILAGDRDAFDLSGALRSLGNGKVTGLSGTISLLSDLGYASNSTDNSLALSDSTALDTALSGNLAAVKDFFTQSTTGFASRAYDFLKKTADLDGTLDAKQKVLGKQVTDIDDQVADQERFVQTNRSAMIDRFVAMETAQAHINQQLQLLNQKFGS